MCRSRAGEGLTQLPIENQDPGTKGLLSTAWSSPALFPSEVLQRDNLIFPCDQSISHRTDSTLEKSRVGASEGCGPALRVGKWMEAFEGRRGGKPLLLLKVWKCEPGPPRALRQFNTLATSWWCEERGPCPAQLELCGPVWCPHMSWCRGGTGSGQMRQIFSQQLPPSVRHILKCFSPTVQ